MSCRPCRDRDAGRTRLTDDDDVPGQALVCRPELGYVLAQVAQTPDFDVTTWRARCLSRDADAQGDADRRW